MTHTDRQRKFLDALTAKLHELDDPDPEIITNEGYRYSLRYMKGAGRKLPRITFTPHGQDQRIKADIMRSAGIGLDSNQEQEIANLREKSGFKKARDSENRILARRFNAYWTGYWTPIAKAIEILQDPQQRFTRPGQTVADPIRLLMEGKLPAEPDAPEAPEGPESRSYAEELMEVD